MMTDCFSFIGANGMSWMMLGAGLFWLLVLTLLILTAVALVKYLRSDGSAGLQRGSEGIYEDRARS